MNACRGPNGLSLVSILAGKPVIRGTRLAVEFILGSPPGSRERDSRKPSGPNQRGHPVVPLRCELPGARVQAYPIAA